VKKVKSITTEAEAFAYKNSEIVIYTSDLAEFNPIQSNTSFNIPYSLTRTSKMFLSDDEEKLLKLIEKFNYFRYAVSKITVYKNKSFNYLQQRLETVLVVVLKLKLESPSFLNRILNTLQKKDSLEKHRTIVGLFNTLFLADNGIEKIEDMRSHDSPPNNVNTIVDVLILFTT